MSTANTNGAQTVVSNTTRLFNQNTLNPTQTASLQQGVLNNQSRHILAAKQLAIQAKVIVSKKLLQEAQSILNSNITSNEQQQFSSLQSLLNEQANTAQNAFTALVANSTSFTAFQNSQQVLNQANQVLNDLASIQQTATKYQIDSAILDKIPTIMNNIRTLISSINK